MSVLVKGMKIPKNCSDCQLNYDMMSCIITGTRFWDDTLMDFDCQESRLYDCPLVELPEKHGRLVDVNELSKKMYHDAFETDTPLQKWDGGCWIRYKMFEINRDAALTVIEAEGVEE